MSGGGFLDRWSRRKRTAAREAPEAPAPQVAMPEVAMPEVAMPERASPEGDAPEPGAPRAEASDPEALTSEELAALPAPEEITADTDIRAFLRKGVPQALRNAALRRKWLLNAAIRDHRDIAVDYAWDWNVPGGVPGDGGPLDRDMVARMADRLMRGPEPAAAVQQPAPEAAAPAPAATPPDDVPPEAVRSAEVAAPAVAPAQPSAPDREASAAAPQRRHGGAAPA